MRLDVWLRRGAKINLGSLSRAARNVSWRLAWALSPVIRAVPFDRSVVVALTPAPAGSFGDEVILRGFMNGLRSDPSRIRFIESSGGRGKGWAQVLGVGQQGPPLSSRIAGIAHLSLLARAKEVYVLGADVLDGHYSVTRSVRRIQFARLAQRAGAQVSIVSYSMNANPPGEVVDEWRRLPVSVRLVARDPHSAARTSTVVGREVILGADLAFLAAEREQAATSPVRSGSLCIVPNSALSAWCGGYDNLVGILAEATRALLALPVVTSVQLMPHDLRSAETNGDVALCHAVMTILEDAPRQPTLAIPKDGLDARAILGSSEVVLTARMHAAIGALCEHRPILLIGYQGKAEGLLEAFELGDQLLEPDVFADVPRLLSSVETTFAKSHDLHSQISTHLPQAVMRAHLNFPHRLPSPDTVV